MQAPSFWHHDNFLSKLLAPLGSLYAWANRLRMEQASPITLPIPVICIGNLIAGGAGKTPVVLAVAQMLANMGKNVHLLSRGYGGNMPGPLQVDGNKHQAMQVGDEPLMLARHFPTWTAWDRAAGAKAAMEAGAEVIVMDDGFQHPYLHKTLSLIVIDGAYGFGNGRMIPAGPLREPVREGMKRAQAVVMIGEDMQAISSQLDVQIPSLQARVTPEPMHPISGKRVIAFAGIGRPEKFFDSVQSLGADIVEKIPFPDHHYFLPHELESLRRNAEKAGALLLTTEKDHMRLPEYARADIHYLPITLSFQDTDIIHRLLEGVFAHAA